jgi:lipid-A-disaccharide synthase
MYKTNKLSYQLVGRWVIASEFFTLPNLIAGREIVPELVPYFKGHERLVSAVADLISSEERMNQQRRELAAATERFAGRIASAGAADAIEEMAGIERVSPTSSALPEAMHGARH